MQELLDKPAPGVRSYASNDPVNRIDPSGRSSQSSTIYRRPRKVGDINGPMTLCSLKTSSCHSLGWLAMRATPLVSIYAATVVDDQGLRWFLAGIGVAIIAAGAVAHVIVRIRSAPA